MKVGYVRVSKHIQNKELQVDALEKIGCEKFFYDEMSGYKADRKGLTELLNFVRPGDTIVLWRLDRLGRNLLDLLTIAGKLEKNQIDLISCTQQIDTTTPTGKFFFHMIAVFAEFEREQLIERTKAGLEAARARGRVGGRPHSLTTAKIKQLRALYESREHGVGEICATMGISRSTLYRYINK